jgi:hypothetical protein
LFPDGKDKEMKNKQRAVCLLMVMASILILAAMWNLPEELA